MAETFLRAIAGDRFEVASAGTEATRVHPLAIRAMGEVGIDVSGHPSKTLEALLDESWDYVITVCDNASQRCPIFPGRTTRMHWRFDDPSLATCTEQDRLETFRRVRDEILAKLRAWLASDRQPSSVVS